MKNFNKIFDPINNKKTLLCVGPMSKNVVDASIELSDKKNIPIILIASRRQVDSEEFGGGYVNGWNTEDFSKYIKKKQRKNNIFLARDHGGPWQNNTEITNKLHLKDAMRSAKISFKDDILNDFSMIHIDTCIDIEKKLTFKNSIDRLLELYAFCNEVSKKNKKKILFEIGTEEQNGSTSNFEELQETLNILKKFCKKEKAPWVTFVVSQSGTRVMETRNVGSFEAKSRVSYEIPVEIHLIKLLEIFDKNNIFFKEHNADYLSDESLKWHPRLGIHAANVAPEFGVAETLCLLNLLKSNNLKREMNHFIELAVESKKWIKWVIDEKKLSDLQKSIICGHYIFNKPEVIEIKNKLDYFLNKKKLNLNNLLKDVLKVSITRYLKNFELI